MARRQGPVNFNRREFMEMAAAAGVACAATELFGEEFVQAQQAPSELMPQSGVKLLQAACPYCGVGCGTLIQVQNGRVVGMVPDKKHPTNRGIQCIKGLNAHEPIYRDRLTKVLVRKDPSDPLKGHVSATKGRFDDEVFEEVSYDEAEEIVAERIAAIIKAKGGNAVGLNGSGQLTMEAQWIENVLMKGVMGSNSIEANARMCMTSAVTGYFHSYGSDAPPTSYEDIEEADMVTFWGHNAREAHPVLFWRVADHKKRKDIPTLVSDPRGTGTVLGLEAINPRNSYHLQTLNGDISYHNAIAQVLLTKHPQACMPQEWLEQNTNGWKEYIEGVKARYSPQQVIERLKLLDRGRVSVELIEEVARQWAEASIKGRERGRGGVLTFWGIGYNQMLHGQHNTIGLINLHLLTGNMGRPGCGSHSQTGQPNAMSERLMGGLTGRLPFNQPLKNEKWRNHIADCWRIPRDRLAQTSALPNPGMVVGMMERALKGDLLAMFWMYTTHIHMPDVETLVRPALSKMYVVVQDIYRHAPNNLYADVVVPAATWGEWTGGTYIQSERRLSVGAAALRLRRDQEPAAQLPARHGHGHRQGQAAGQEAGIGGGQDLPLREEDQNGQRPDGLRSGRRLPRHPDSQQGGRFRRERPAGGRARGRHQPLRAVASSSRDPVARAHGHDRPPGRHPAALPGSGRLGRQALRGVRPQRRQGQVQALRAGLLQHQGYLRQAHGVRAPQHAGGGAVPHRRAGRRQGRRTQEHPGGGPGRRPAARAARPGGL
ncbi:MAG: molybdopterin-dependent oxidoreductase [Planctomycetota bacterium]|jgi:anaerobic selenocysteine-containing dehydrogenase